MSISVKIVADSVSHQGIRLTTYELEYPRYIHAEVKTHRMFRFGTGTITLHEDTALMDDPMLSRNAQSSRAVPVTKSLELPYVVPIVWGKNKAGMSSAEELEGTDRQLCEYYWYALVRYSKDFSDRMSKAGLHKQWANRPLEWHSNIKVIVTATEWDNFFWLRDDPDAAQPEIVDLARKMQEAMNQSVPSLLEPGQWHLPYVETYRPDYNLDELRYFVVTKEATTPDGDREVQYVDLETAKKISASCCASVSYRKIDTSIEKALSIYDKLFSGPKPHLSPVEHLATPMSHPSDGYDEGATHVSVEDGSVWSNNLRGWVQYRKLLEKEFGHNTLR